MFCYQCEQAAKGAGCTVKGVCGKEESTSALQDLLLHATKGVSAYAARAGKLGAHDRDVDMFTVEAVFSTLTNVNFDDDRVAALIYKAEKMRDRAKKLYADACGKAGQTPEKLAGAASFIPAKDMAGLLAQGYEVPITARIDKLGADVAGVQELLTYGIKGTAAYADHAHVLGQDDDALYLGIHEAIDFLNVSEPGLNDLVGMCLRTGELNLRAMELLDAGNTGEYGHPVPTPVRINPVKGKAILVSGHDLKDLEELLRQTAGKGINVYTHGEMLPAHGYPKLKEFGHLAGNYGGAWQDQAKEFDAFPGAVLMTTNCIQRPKASYKGRIFTSGLVAWPGVKHVADMDFSPVIEAALAAPGFTEDGPDKTILTGFARNTVMGVADKVIEGVKSKAIRHFFLVGGCDGAKPGRNYYTDLAQAIPADCVILTLACGKYRFNKLEFGDIGGIPRLLDVGQCNDAYSAIQIAVALSKAFNCGVNDLPLSLVLSWYEQKAVSILLTLLFLGIKDIRLGPSLPKFVTPAVLDVLVQNFGIKPVTTPEADLKAILG
ncbi:MAG: hydroxylamine reductase [Nitrospirae bacterium]|nr:hydroxylamine reductase [Nitrospirota bacterium]